jgi:hypothetical protein
MTMQKEDIVSSSSDFARDFLILRNAIIDNCKDCIRDCGRDCLDGEVKPLENIRCPLQKVRMDYKMAIENTPSNMWKNRDNKPDFR